MVEHCLFSDNLLQGQFCPEGHFFKTGHELFLKKKKKKKIGSIQVLPKEQEIHSLKVLQFNLIEQFKPLSLVANHCMAIY